VALNVRRISEKSLAAHGESRLRLLTIVRLRWFAILGQIMTVCGVWFWLGFSLPIGYCLAFIALSAWLNVFLAIRFPGRHRLGQMFATAILAYDILQLAGLLYLTGGIENPFAMLIVAPVTVSAATLPPRNTILLGLAAAGATALIAVAHYPLPWEHGIAFELPFVYKSGLLAAVLSTMAFLGLYGWRLAKESREMMAALAATEFVLAREQKLHALDDLAAAAAHELGTPLSTIVLIAKELERDAAGNAAFSEDLALLRGQAQRCREILRKLTKRQDGADPLVGRVGVRELIEEAASPYRSLGKTIEIHARPAPRTSLATAREPMGERRPGMIYGLGNIIENAVEFAAARVDVLAEWTGESLNIVVTDDGPGFPPELIDTIGEPYVTKRGPMGASKRGKSRGLGLGVFIAKTLLERSGASVALENKAPPARGAVVRVAWGRRNFEARTRQPESAAAAAPP